MVLYEGFHGTSEECATQIKTDNFNVSNGTTEWMGEGIYFFIQGIGGKASELAKDFASYRGHVNNFTRYSILKADISADPEKVLDLRLDDSLDAYNMVRNFVVHRFEKEFPRDRELSEDNCTVHNMVKKHMKLDIVIQNLYIKQHRDRIMRLGSQVPNVTVLCATSADSVNIDSIEVIESGENQ